MILYGPPAAGKDTISAELTQQDAAYQLFPVLKAGPGKTTGYRMTTPEHLQELDQLGRLVWRIERYGSIYAIDADGLDAALRICRPVVHLGKVEGVRAVLDRLPEARWLVVGLVYPREVAETRLRQRNDADVRERLRIFDATEPLPDALSDLQVNTAGVSPIKAARLILNRAQDTPASGNPA